MSEAGRARTRAIALLSGGLDSSLAASLVLEQGIDVVGVSFVGPFCACTPRHREGCHLASAAAQSLGIELRILAKGIDYLRLVERPRFGRGRGLNPCIDCRVYMLRHAAALMAEEDASFIVTGEVLGQRPMSQHRRALELIERESGLAGRLLRPLSAHLLEPTDIEASGLVDRSRLLAISGRSRAQQLGLANARGVEVFACGGGGCLLTDPVVARRMQDLFDHCPDYDMADAKAATFGRHFRLSETVKVILGRDQGENERLVAVHGRLPRIELVTGAGPTAVLRGDYVEADLAAAGRLLRRYAKKVLDPVVEMRLVDRGRVLTWFEADAATDDDVARWSLPGTPERGRRVAGEVAGRGAGQGRITSGAA